MKTNANGPRPVSRALGYLRVSTVDQAVNGYGLDAQRQAIAAEADRRRWPVEFVADEGKSGSQINPALRDALDQLRHGRADALIVAKVDRLARSVVDTSNIMDRAKNEGWDLIICDLGVNLSTPAGRSMAQMLATFAEFERGLIATRTREGLAAARARGVQIGRPRLTPAAVMDSICRQRATGASFGAIARDLTAAGILSPAGKPVWQSSTVRRAYNSACPAVA